MKTMSFEVGEISLADLLEKVSDGETITITRDGQPKAMLVTIPPSVRPRPQRGSLRGRIQMAPDFDAPLDEFKDYVG